MRLFIGTIFEKDQLLQLEKIQQQWLSQIKEGAVPINQPYYVWHIFDGENNTNDIAELSNKLKRIEGACFYTSFCDMTEHFGNQISVQLKTCNEFLSIKKQLEILFINESNLGKKFRPTITIFNKCELLLPFSEAKKSVMLFNKPFLCTGFDLLQSAKINGKSCIKSFFHYDFKK